MKHVGKFGEKPCIVVFREVPNEPEHCLIVQTGSLEPAQHDALMNVIQSPEAQESNDVSEVLHRRQFVDGSNMLASLHNDRKIEKVAVNLVSLTPTPAESIPLAEVNAMIRKLENDSNPPLKTDPTSQQNRPIETDPVLNEQAKQAPVMNEQAQAAEASGDPAEIANNLLLQASVIEDDAKVLMRDAEAKRNEAYRLNPELKPKKGPGRPKKTVTAEA